jgi:SAM-dependent methyltransferase
VYEILRDRCGLAPGARVLEIGPGPGLATAHLIDAGAIVVAVEPDPALAEYLDRTVRDAGATIAVHVATFESVAVPAASFDLAVAATSFHWVDQSSGLRRVFDLLQPGGWWAAWWNVFGDPDRYDAFHEATEHCFEGLAESPASGGPGVPFGLDAEARVADLAGAGFEQIAYERMPWALTLPSVSAVRALYATYSPITRLDAARRETVLDEIARVADEQFGGRVERNMITALYTARRPAAP